MHRRVTQFLVLFAALASVFGLVACGGDDKQKESQDANNLLKETFSGGKKIKSGQLKVAISVDTEGLKKVTQPIKLDLTGAFATKGDHKLPDFDLSLTAGAEGRTLSAGAISTGDAGYLKFQGVNYKVDNKLFNQFKKGFEQARSKSENKAANKKSLSALGLEPLTWISDSKVVGDTKVGDADTTHISANVDVKSMLENINDAITKNADKLGGKRAAKLKNGIPQATQDQIIEAVKTATIDVYTGKDDKILRKLSFTLDVDVPAEQQKKANGLKSAKIDFDLELTEVNQPQQIEAPPNSKPLSSLLKSLSGLAKGLSAAGGGAAPQ